MSAQSTNHDDHLDIGEFKMVIFGRKFGEYNF